AYIVSQFVGFQQLQRPFQRAFEEVAKVAAKLPEVEQEAVALRAEFDERDAVAEAAGARAAAVEERLAGALAEIEKQRAQIAEMGGDLQAAGVEAAVREAALVQAERMAQERAVALEVMQAEIIALWDSLGQLREEAQQREAATLAVRGELVSL